MSEEPPPQAGTREARQTTRLLVTETLQTQTFSSPRLYRVTHHAYSSPSSLRLKAPMSSFSTADGTSS
jgi:hypothetical protein